MSKHGRIFISNHAIDRFKERFQSLCKSDKGFTTKNIIKDIMYGLMDSSIDNRTFLNNTFFMTKMFEKYGYDRHYKFLVYDNVVFVVLIDHEESRMIVVTCMSLDMVRLSKVKKYQKKELPEDLDHYSKMIPEPFDDFLNELKKKTPQTKLHYSA